MNSFLKTLAKELYGRFGNDLSDFSVVFPSRRAGMYFKKYLTEEINSPIWAQVFSIRDFIEEYAGLIIPDKLTLLFELYEIYRKHSEDESFEKFYPWGEILLNDFDEIDKNLADAGRLFRILIEHKTVEDDFELKVSDIEEFHRFWQSFSGRELPELQKEFIKTWEIMGKVYHGFQKALLDKKLGYEGMAYRRLYEKLLTDEPDLNCKQVVFAGFNLLNRAEEEIFKLLINRNKALTFWDIDEYYFNDKIQEAGKFLRNNISSLGINRPGNNSTGISSPEFISGNLLSKSKQITTIGCVQQVSQTKVLGNELNKLTPEELNRTAVILPDENLLIPVLYSLPGGDIPVNITMGYPFKSSALYALIQLLMSLNKNKKISGKQSVFYYKDVLQVLTHPYIKDFSPAENMLLFESIRKNNNIYISLKKIREFFADFPEILKVIFTNAKDTAETITYLSEIINILSDKLNREANPGIDTEFLYKCRTELNRLNDLTGGKTAEFEQEMFWKLLMEILNTLKIPFSGEPLQGLQVMGLLETRLLDFDNVYILSMNEGIMPRGNNSGSFIPYHLRKAFKLPCYEDDDANAAYNFYRLLQRAGNVTLIYNTEAGALSGGEKSRFIMQIEKELVQANRNIKYNSRILNADIEITKRQDITIDKLPGTAVIPEDKRNFSPTILTSYIHCPLQFYFKKIAGLKEEESVEEYFSGGGFGSVLHQIMDIMYRDYTGKTVDEKVINKLQQRLKQDYDVLWSQACDELPGYGVFKKDLQGKNLLYRSIIRKLIENILEYDFKETPFNILFLERELKKIIKLDTGKENFTVTLKGRLDRLEEKDGIARIVDYKTGKVETINSILKITDEEYIEKIFSDSAYKEGFQQLFYASLFFENEKNKPLKIGLYSLQKPSEGIYWFDGEPVSENKIRLFEDSLNKMITGILDDKTPFTQTDDVKKCLYCPYKSICFRD